ncbi:hypothetical protein I6F29_36065 [Bradyrhizobium sp. NBAIM16]|uniref:hypothetical protein n=1 Tax=Bradyrhizobium sp. NBAIM16 TaxID=2793813 RepID=UPI001CD37D72|nr:hypothetical protein [Bradyrhizobium sp. NBAIM16]MCA1431265.1 hypothetical protein [Bradyrhizobium sp. NBAIM16]
MFSRFARRRLEKKIHTQSKRKSIGGHAVCTDKEFKAFLLTIPKLNPDQRKRALDRFKALGGVLPSSSSEPIGNGENDWLLAGIAAALHEHGIINKSKLYEPAVSIGIKNYTEKMKTARETLEAGSPRKLSFEEKVLLAQLATQAMITRFRTKTTVSKVLNCVDQLPAYFDESFPGYLRNRMILVVLGTPGKRFHS